MAIALDASSKSATALTWAHTCTGSNLYLFVASSSGTTSVTYNGTAMTLLSYFQTGNYGGNQAPEIKVWGLANPSTGTNNIVANAGTSFVAVSYTGVDPSPNEAYNFTETQATPVPSLSSSVTTITANAWLVAFGFGNGNTGRYFIDSTDTVVRQTNTEGGSNYASSVCDSDGAKATPGSYTLYHAWSSGSGFVSSVIYSLKPYLKISFSGPSSGNVNAASTNFTITPDVAINGTVTITPTGAGSSGLSATVLTFNNSSAAQTFTITPLTSGDITLTVTNNVGLNNPSPLTYTAVAVAPDAPTIGTATAGNAQATVSFSANSNGGSVVTQYRAISTPGSVTGTASATPITVIGLTNGSSYTFTVRATNAVGNSAESSASNSVTPYVPATTFTFTGPSSGDVRSASTNFTVTPDATYDGTITITPSGPGSTGLSPVVLTWSLSSAAQTFTITPTNSGVITLTPTNSGSLSNPANLTYTAIAVVPLAPQIGVATPSISSAIVTFSAPTNNGGSTITSYRAISTPGSFTGTVLSVAPITVTGLTNGSSYTFTVRATNAVGNSAESSATSAVIPSASSPTFTNSGPKFEIEGGVGNLLTF